MTLPYKEMLEKLKRLDPVTYSYLVTFNVNLGLPESCPRSMHIITGCIQDACERYGWDTALIYRSWRHLPQEKRHNAIIINECDAYNGSGGTPTEALLSAYIKAISSIGSDDIDLANVDWGD